MQLQRVLPDEALRLPGWDVWSLSVAGRRRDRMEDARTVEAGRPALDGSATGPGCAAHVIGVFDGVGGLPHAKAAAQAAARGAAHAVASTDGTLAALLHLNRLVMRTGGASTAVLATLDPASPVVDIASVGDGGAYTLDARGALIALTPKDQADPKRLTDHLGWASCVGHSTSLPSCDRLLLCTDGVDAVVNPTDLRDALRAADSGEAAARRLLQCVDEGGRPDDATFVLALRNVNAT